MEILFIALGVILYSLSVGLLNPYCSRQLALRCPNCSKGKEYFLDGERLRPGDKHFGLLLAAIWPVSLPYLVANYKADPKLRLANDRINNYWTLEAKKEQAKMIASLEKELQIGS